MSRSTVPTRDDDERDLEFLDLAAEMGPTKAAKQMGWGRGAGIGFRYRVLAAAEALPCKCRRKRNRDGGMPAGWWR